MKTTAIPAFFTVAAFAIQAELTSAKIETVPRGYIRGLEAANIAWSDLSVSVNSMSMDSNFMAAITGEATVLFPKAGKADSESATKALASAKAEKSVKSAKAKSEKGEASAKAEKVPEASAKAGKVPSAKAPVAKASASSKAEKGTEADHESDGSSDSKAEKGPKAKAASDEDSIAKSGKEFFNDSESATKTPASANANKMSMLHSVRATKVFKVKSAKGEDAPISKAEKGAKVDHESDSSSASRAEKGPAEAKAGKPSSGVLDTITGDTSFMEFGSMPLSM